MHMMIDLETLSTQPNAVITQLAAVLFDPAGMSIEATFEAYPDPVEQIRMGRHVDFNTIKWWMGQSDDARAGFNRPVELVQRVAADFMAAFDWEKIEGVWGHGANFDPVLVEDFLFMCNFKTPWKYNVVRDTRTLFWLIPTPMEKASVKHSAIGDAIAQIATVQLAYATFEKMKKEHNQPF